MPLDSNTVFQTATNITANGSGPWVDTGDGEWNCPMWCMILVTGTIGNPQVIFGMESSPDENLISMVAFDEQAPINIASTHMIGFVFKNRYIRLAWWFQSLNPGLGSGNSSSCSAQSFNSSSCSAQASVSMNFFAQAVALRAPADVTIAAAHGGGGRNQSVHRLVVYRRGFSPSECSCNRGGQRLQHPDRGSGRQRLSQYDQSLCSYSVD